MNLLLAKEIEDSLPKNTFFVTCMYLEGNLRVRLATHRKSEYKEQIKKAEMNSLTLTPRGDPGNEVAAFGAITQRHFRIFVSAVGRIQEIPLRQLRQSLEIGCCPLISE